MGELKLSIGVDTRQAIRETKNFGKALDGLADDFEAAAKQGDLSVDDMIKSLRELSRAAKTESAKVDRSLTHGGFDKAKHASGEFKDEALSNFSEVTSSFDGSMSSIGDLAQGTLGGLAASLPGIGVAAGIAALGVGLITTELENQQIAADEMKQHLVDAYKEASEEGRAFLSEAQIIAASEEILFDSDKRKTAASDAKRIGVDLLTLVRAMAGDEEALDKTIAASNRKYEERVKHIEDSAGAQAETAKGADGELRALDRINASLGVQRKNHDANKQAVRDMNVLRTEGEKKVQAETKRTQDALIAITKGKYPVDMSLRADTSQLDAQLRNYRPPTISVNLRGEIHTAGGKVQIL
jgi:hypothetical protein